MKNQVKITKKFEFVSSGINEAVFLHGAKKMIRIGLCWLKKSLPHNIENQIEHPNIFIVVSPPVPLKQ